MDMGRGRDPFRTAERDAIGARVRAMALKAGARPSAAGFCRMFPELAAAEHRLPEGGRTIVELLGLGSAMAEPAAALPEPRVRSAGDGCVPAGYTYLLAFVLNDLVMERMGVLDGRAADFVPRDDVSGLFNRRTGRLELDSLYDAPRDPADLARLLVGPVASSGGGLPRPPRKADRNDLPRLSRSLDAGRDRVARCGDPRNDDLLILSQLHVAFLKAHNALVGAGRSFEGARRALRQRYQWMVLFDLLAQLCDPVVLDDVAARGPRVFTGAGESGRAMPVEFCAAAFALAPTMMRASYDYNPSFRQIARGALVTRFALGTAGRGPDSLPEQWIIGWEGFLPLEGRAPQRARAFNTELAGAPRTAAAIATYHLLDGYRLGLPTGQAVARTLGIAPLAGDALLAGLPERQRAAVRPFSAATPLWFYLLAEAGAPDGPAGRHLGVVGSRIVAETLWRLVGASDSSILAPDADLDFERFTLSDLVLLAGEQDLFTD
ncbi:peroxidase family protein [Xanthobacter agilis]|uniref:Heme peroxidase n=1 Tax=Xanthobacter agilis TaxID=47492 RepID=A0ABU0LFL0_XANAG|nr:hypothetical protein [Xanthobacter agilis]MDQ0505923.1 hypothetical protein [Xanthobacter agilis]